MISESITRVFFPPRQGTVASKQNPTENLIGNCVSLNNNMIALPGLQRSTSCLLQIFLRLPPNFRLHCLSGGGRGRLIIIIRYSN